MKKQTFNENDEVIVTPRKEDYPDIPYINDFFAIVVEDSHNGTFLVQDKEDIIYIVKASQLKLNNQ